MIFVTNGSTLNLYGNNGSGGSGTGVLGVVLGQNGNFDIAGTTNIGAVISDGGNGFGFTKSGDAGVLSLSAANTYSGVPESAGVR